MSNKESKWSKYDSKIDKMVKKYPTKGYTYIAKKVFPKGSYADYDVLRTYIRRGWDDMRQKLRGEEPKNPVKLLVYDLETSRIPAKVWWTGKQYVGHNQLQGEAKIITVAWKFVGEDKVHTLTWDKDHNDEDMVRKFAEVYNSADMVIGQNSDRFDNRWLAARAAKYSIPLDVNVKSFDIMKQAKRLFRLPSYSMKYMCEYFGVTQKLSHEGISMWDKCEDGSPEEQKKALKAMTDYNIGDIISTEDLYFRLRKYMKHKLHLGVLKGSEAFSCPDCGGHNLKLVKTTTTAAGTVQRWMECQDDKVTFKLSNRNYIKYLEREDEI